MTATQINTAELSGAALDWAVAVAEGHPLCEEAIQGDFIMAGTGKGDLYRFQPTKSPEQCFEFIRTEGWAIYRDVFGRWHVGDYHLDTGFETFGESKDLCVAICRAQADKLGPTVSVPTELVEGGV